MARVQVKSALKTTFLVFALTIAVCNRAVAGDFRVTVTNTSGEPLEHAIVTLTPKFSLQNKPVMGPDAVMRQQNTLFAPFVLPVQVGTSVSFPNLDESRHHVYSFSKAKRFELRLYGKDETNSISFEQPGVVALGCNIHDNMLAYVYVTEAPIFLKTDTTGGVLFEGLEVGAYEVEAWHPGVRKKGSPKPATIMIANVNDGYEIALQMRRVWGEQRAPAEDQY